MSSLTCITCQVAFKESDMMREHYKSDWHRYNLKRKVAAFPPVSAEAFKDLLTAQKTQEIVGVAKTCQYCDCCNKKFNTESTYSSHVASKKHKQMMNKFKEKRREASKDRGRKDSVTVEEEEEDSDMEVLEEEVDSDEWEEEEIVSEECLFCSHLSASLDDNLDHMTYEHSFFIPDIEYLTDLNGLLKYLAQKISYGYMCLWCSERGRRLTCKVAAQHHMIDKGHTKMKHEGATLAEYEEFYDYSSSYPDQGDPDQQVDIPVLDDSNYQLMLPSGSSIGHRSLVKYYKQKLRAVRAAPRPNKLDRVISTYRAIGWHPTTKQEAHRKAKDIAMLQAVKHKHNMQVGVKANRLQPHFRCQNPK